MIPTSTLRDGDSSLLCLNNLDEAKEKFLSDPDCNFDGAILMHSGYSYAPSWGFYCCSPDAVQGSNRNWNLYQLSKLSPTDEQNDEEVCSNVRVTVSGSTVLTQFSGNYVSSSVTEKDELPVRNNDKGMSLWHDDETWVITPPESSSLGIFVEVSGSPGTMPSNGLWTGELVKNEADYRDVDVKFECLDSDPENNCVSVDTPFNGIYYETDKMRNGLPVYVEDTHGYELFHDEEVWVFVDPNGKVGIMAEYTGSEEIPADNSRWVMLTPTKRSFTTEIFEKLPIHGCSPDSECLSLTVGTCQNE